MAYMNQGNWGSFLQAVPQGVETEQNIQGKDYANQQAANATDKSNIETQALRDQNDQQVQMSNRQAAQNNANPGAQQMPYQNYTQQTGGVFDPARNAIHSALANIGQFYQKVFHPQQGQTNPAAAPSGRGPGPAAQQTLPGPGQTGAQAPAAMSRPGPESSGPAQAGTPGATGPMPQPQYAEGGAIPGRKLQGIRPKKAKKGNIAKPTAGDKQVANQQPGAGGPPMQAQPQPGPQMTPRNTEPGAGISNQDPDLSAADGKWIQGAIKHPGALHKELGVPEGEKIPKSKIKAAEGSENPKLAKRAQLADTMSKFKDGGLPSLPKLQPGAAPEPKPAPNMVEKDVAQNGMRHYLGKTIKRYADGDAVEKHEPNADVPTPAGLVPAGSPKLDLPSKDTGGWGGPVEPGPGAFAVGGAPNANVGNPTPPPAAPTPGSVAVGGAPNADVDVPPPEMPHSPGKGASPPQQNAAPGAPRAAEEEGPPAPHKGGAGVFDQQGPAGVEEYNRVASGGYDKNGKPIEQGPPNPNAAPVDFSQVKADQSQVPTMSTQDWQMMHNSMRQVAVAHGMSVGQADMAADEEITKYQHGNFMQYMQQAAALDAGGNKQGAMAALKTAYQFFPTGHDMHFGLAPNGDILGYGVNEKTGEPVQNGLIHLNQQNLHSIMTHFSNPENFVNEGIRLQTSANETAHTGAQIGLEHGQAAHAYAGAEYLKGRNAAYLGAAEERAGATRARLSNQAQTEYTKAFNQYGIQDPEALAVAGELESRLNPTGNRAYQDQIAGEIAKMYGPGTDPTVRANWLKSKGITLAGQQTAQNSPVPNRYEDSAATFNALNSQ